MSKKSQFIFIFINVKLKGAFIEGFTEEWSSKNVF